MSGQERKGGFVLPLILVALGIILLLNNLGRLSWDVWEYIVRLWPILLIAAGLDLISGRGATRFWLAVIVFFVVLGGAALVIVDLVVPGTEQSIDQGLEGAAQAKVELNCSACALRLGPGSAQEDLIEGQVMLGWNDNLRQMFQIIDGTAEFTLEGKKTNPFPSFGKDHRRDWTLWLNPDVPIALKVSTGVGRSNLDLARLTLTEFELSSGVGEITVSLPTHGRFTAVITSGEGEITVLVPRGLSMRVQLESGVGDIDLPEDYGQQGDVYTSPGYETAEHRVELEVKSEVDQITIKEQGSV